MKYAVLFCTSPTEGKSWRFIEAESPAEAASLAGGRSVTTDDKAFVFPIGKGPVAVYARVDWSE